MNEGFDPVTVLKNVTRLCTQRHRFRDKEQHLRKWRRNEQAGCAVTLRRARQISRGEAKVECTHAQIAPLIDRAQIHGNGFRDERLTQTENRIAASVARGLTNKEIAAEMEISVRTVENHVSHIPDKKHFHNRRDRALRYGTWRVNLITRYRCAR